MAKFNLKSLKLVKKDQWQALVDKVDAQTAEIAAATAFIKEIEKGNLESANLENVDENSLTGSLINMRNKMKQIAQEEAQRNWITEGLAKFSDILRSNDNDLAALANQIISELVKYMGANQGGLYLVNDNDKEDVFIELIAAYAYNRRKFLEQKIGLGQGILGQAVLEKGTVVLTDVPDTYVRITSGLGEALPRNIIIVPLKLEERVYGLVEIASFQTIKTHQIQFVEKLSENVASTIASAKNAERTQKLLRESQIQTEQLRSQEEEVRQNMEELAATQEEMQRVLAEVQKNEKAVNELINVSSDSILTIDRGYKVVAFNKAFTDGLGSLNIQKGFNLMSIFPAHEQASRKQVYNRAFAGETFEMIDHSDITGKESYFKVRYAPLYDMNGAISTIAIFATDVTELHISKQLAEKSAEEARSREEEIRQNMEELAATQEEMQRILHEVQKNEKEINELLDVSTDSIMTIDLDYKLVRFNRVLVKAFPNLKIEKGFSVFDFFVTNEEKKNKKIIYNQAFAGKVTESLDHIHIGNLDLYFRVIHSPIYDTEGKVTSIAIYATDISELHKAKAMAEQNEKEITDLINTSSDSIVVLDKDSKVLLYNKVFASSLKGFKVEKGFSTMQLYSPEKQKEKKETHRRVFEGETIEAMETIMIDGKEGHYRIKYAPIFNGDGKVESIAAYVADITELFNAKRAAEQQAQEMKAREENISAKFKQLETDYKKRIAELENKIARK